VLDEIWVPTAFHSETFRASGVVASKLHIVPEPVDTGFFDPAAVVTPLVLPMGKAVAGPPGKKATLATGSEFAFLSVFKWEDRKGWDILLRAFAETFTADDNVALYLLVSRFHQTDDLARLARDYIQRIVSVEGRTPAPVHVIDKFLSAENLRRLYQAVDAFVLPSRGEGWGRPHVEAMAMSLPVIATNWSGPTAFLTAANGCVQHGSCRRPAEAEHA